MAQNTLNVWQPTDIPVFFFIGFIEIVFIQPYFNCFPLFIMRLKSHLRNGFESMNWILFEHYKFKCNNF